MTYFVISWVSIVAGKTDWSPRGWATFTWWEQGSMCIKPRWSTWLSPQTSFPCLTVTQIQSAVQAWKGSISEDSYPQMTVRVTPHQPSDEVIAKSEENFEWRMEKIGISCDPRSTPTWGAIFHPTHILWKRGLWEPWYAALWTWVEK